MRIITAIVLFLLFHLGASGQSSIVYDVNDFINPGLTTNSIPLPNSDSTIRVSRISTTFFGAGTEFSSFTDRISINSPTLILWFNKSIYIKKHQLNFKLENINSLSRLKFPVPDSSQFSYKVKPKIQYGYYFFTNKPSKYSIAHRIQGSISPQIKNSEFAPELEIDLTGKYKCGSGFNSLANYFFVYSPEEKRFNYGISTLTPLYTTNKFINSVKIQFEYFRDHRFGNDQGELLNLGILTESNIGSSSLYASLNYYRDYNFQSDGLMFSAFLLLHGSSKVSYIKEKKTGL